MVMVPWPVGPSGDQEANRQKIVGGAFYFIPVGTEDPELVYNVFYDLHNWYHDDITIRDDRETMSWWYGITAKEPEIQDHNFEVMFNAGAKEQYDNWSGMENDVGCDWLGFFNGDYTPAQFQEQYKQTVQDALDRLNGK